MPASYGADHLGGVAADARARRDVSGHQRSGLDERPGADAHALQDGGVGPDPDVVLDDHLALRGSAAAGRPLPSGEHAIASAMRSAGAIGWKSVSAMVVFQPITT